MKTSNECLGYLRGLAPGQHRSKETSQRWRAAVDAAPNLTGPGIEPKPSAPLAMSLFTMSTAGYATTTYFKNLVKKNISTL